ncbi:hypothetical protein SNEBB_008689 [Seison nebaliae]|nr:hypothetical protein SNEBB_008689 [Seison nebaliae]
MANRLRLRQNKKSNIPKNNPKNIDVVNDDRFPLEVKWCICYCERKMNSLQNSNQKLNKNDEKRLIILNKMKNSLKNSGTSKIEKRMLMHNICPNYHSKIIEEEKLYDNSKFSVQLHSIDEKREKGGEFVDKLNNRKYQKTVLETHNSSFFKFDFPIN